MAKYLHNEEIAAMTVEQLLKARRDSQNNPGRTLGEQGNARSNVMRINKALRAMGIDPATGKAAAKGDTTGIVAAAIRPLKDAAVDHARDEAAAYAARVAAKYEGQDIEAAFPLKGLRYGSSEYKRMASQQQAVLQIMDAKVQPGDEYKPHAPRILRASAAKQVAFVRSEREAAAASFDAYVEKLVYKVGEGVTAAEVDGSRLWLASVLKVTKGTTVERWKTQQIVNYSVLGNAYLQWPTRKMK